MYNLLGILLFLAIGIWVYRMYKSTHGESGKHWPALPEKPRLVYPVSQEVEGGQVGAVGEGVMLPQYGYYHYRTPYFVNKQVPCVIFGVEVEGDVVYYRANSLLKEEELFGFAVGFDLLGVEAPELFIYY